MLATVDRHTDMKDVLLDITFILSLIVFSIIEFYVESHNLKCPSKAGWSIRAKFKCTDTLTYFCLYNNVEGKYVEGCKGPDWDRKGSKRIFSGSFTRAKCKQHRFQPFNFQTNASMSDCIYEKSLCSEEGQTIDTYDSTKDDRTCRCDFKKKYSFIKKPRNVCFCIPSEEDCSCYKKSCPGNYTLSGDYECVQLGLKENQKCIHENRYYGISEEKTRVTMKTNNMWLIETTYTMTMRTMLYFLCFLCITVAGGFFLAVLLQKWTFENYQSLRGCCKRYHTNVENVSSIEPSKLGVENLSVIELLKHVVEHVDEIQPLKLEMVEGIHPSKMSVKYAAIQSVQLVVEYVIDIQSVKESLAEIKIDTKTYHQSVHRHSV